MNVHRRVLLALAVAVTASSPGATSSVGTADVAMVEGQPCFSVPTRGWRDWRPKVTALSVVAAGADWRDPESTVWSFAAARRGAFLEPPREGCYRYGVVPELGSADGTARALQPGRPYVVTLSAERQAGETSAMPYTARFCVWDVPGGRPELRVVRWDEKARRHTDELCRSAP